MATEVVESHGGEVPRTMDALVKLPGVGRKTANVVLGHALGVPGLPVDRHVLRVANRIGIAKSDDPEVVEQQLCAAMPPAAWTRTSDTLILHGRRICKPRPLCDRCAVRGDCDFYAHLTRSTSTRPAPAVEKREAGRDAGTVHRASSKMPCATSPGDFATRWPTWRWWSKKSPRGAPRRNGRRPGRHTSSASIRESRCPQRGWSYGNALPDRISIYQIPIEDACEDDDEIRDCVAETVIHEFGHYFGMSEEEIEEIEEKYWRGESLDDV